MGWAFGRTPAPARLEGGEVSLKIQKVERNMTGVSN